jgi:2,4-dienoyl-CoA reductase-like NADH-dependent reductase (Old Yellow Enzyme family)
VKLARLRTAEAFRTHLESLGVALPFDHALAAAGESPLATPLSCAGRTAGNRFAILPMEGWDGTPDGRPTDLVRRRWTHFGESGAKLVWGGEAVAVRPDGRANPNQLCLGAESEGDWTDLRRTLVEAHEAKHGSSEDLVVGLQLTHSGRFARPEGAPSPRIAYRHPVLDGRVGLAGEDGDRAVLSDDEMDALADRFVEAAVLAERAGFHFVDVKHCHGYLGHELLSARERAGRYGGAGLEERTGFLRRVLEGIRARAPGLAVGVRLSAYDMTPYRPGEDGVGEPEAAAPYPFAFGGDGTGTGIDLAETSQLLSLFEGWGVGLVCLTAGSPYYNPHIQRPAFYPPSDGYKPPEDPLVGVARMIGATAELKRRHPGLVIVGSGYSYLQEWLPHVAQRVVADGGVDSVGIGRMALSYPELPADVLAGRPLATKAICRTFSDCTTAPRNGLVSGCYPIDPFYKRRPEAERLAEVKARAAGRGAARSGNT